MNRELNVLPPSPLPPLYARWMDTLLAAPIPRETDATCDNCAMAPPAGAEPDEVSHFFNPAVKCCTYIPDIPNFLAGRILADDNTTLATRMRGGVGVTPLGVAAPPRFQAIYKQSGGVAFGRAGSLLCPHFLAEGGGRCGIWGNRNSVCVTWFCKYVRGATGYRFWEQLKQLLGRLERELAVWCLAQFAWDTDTLAAILAFNPDRLDADGCDDKVNPSAYRVLWGRWAGREAEFYSGCARLVNALTWAEVLAACGPEVALHARLTQAAFDQLNAQEIAPRLQPGVFRINSITAGSCQIGAYNGNDPLVIPKVVLDALPYFTGRTVAEAQDLIAASLKVRLTPGLLRKLCDFQILVPSKEKAGAGPALTAERI